MQSNPTTTLSLILAIVAISTMSMVVDADQPGRAASDIEVRPAKGFGMLRDGVAHDAGEFYRASGRAIRLFRSLEKVAVRGEAHDVTMALIKTAVGAGLSVESRISAVDRVILRTDHLLTPRSLNVLLKAGAVDPVYINEETGNKMIVTNRFVVRLADGADRVSFDVLNRAQGVEIVATMHGSGREFVCRVPGASAAATLQTCEHYHQDASIAWASPDFVHKVKWYYTPADPFYADQWHLDNAGQSGGTPDADVDAAEAWDRTDLPLGGSPDVVIGIVDSGVDLDHEDLAANIYENPLEAAGDPGVDDDGNGYTDDVNGWDFYDNDNSPDPTAAGDPDPVAHGTCVAGVAAAVEGNGVGGVGVAFGCKVLAVKISADSGDFASSTALGNAIRYAADMANVLNGSWGISDDATVHSAIQYAVNTQGRPVFFATGNGAAGGAPIGPCWVKETVAAAAGTRYFEWGYNSAFIAQGEDTLWIEDIVFPDGSEESFEGAFPPPGWTTGGDAGWTPNGDSKHARGTGCYSGESGGIGASQTTWLRSPQYTFDAGDLTFYRWVDCGACLVGAGGYLEIEGDTTVSLTGACLTQFDVGYPARYEECIAVGASTDFDYRSGYSQYDETLTNVLDIVAPSDGGNGFIITTDIAGAQGYDPGDYLAMFGGTSSASPLAAGVAALVLSKNPTLSAAEVQAILEDTAEEIGCQSYDGNGYNKYYGHGRVNAFDALAATPSQGTLLGDLNCDGDVNTDDIGHFVQALVDWDGYVADHDGDPYPSCDPWLANMNEDGAVDGLDIQPFVDKLLSGG